MRMAGEGGENRESGWTRECPGYFAGDLSICSSGGGIVEFRNPSTKTSPLSIYAQTINAQSVRLENFKYGLDYRD